MCSECWQTPCSSRCPNAPEPTAIEKCSCCNEGIVHGEEMVEIDGEYYHLECVESMTTRELLELLGIDVVEAKEEM